MRWIRVHAVLCLGLAATVAAGELPKRFRETAIEIVKKDKVKTGEREHAFEMVLIPGGTLTMGSADAEKNREEHEGARHAVAIKPFYLCTTETTFDLFMAYYNKTHQPKRDKGLQPPMIEWQEAMAKLKKVDAIVGPTPIYGDVSNSWGFGRRPAIMVTWYSAMIYCKWLSRKTGKTYRLPTEAEWEYAARAGTTTAYFFGDDPGDLGDYAWYVDNIEDTELGQGTQEVGQKKPNPWGLHDIYGNVAEWCIDFYGEGTYNERAKVSPWDGTKPLARAKVHVARGGSWDSLAHELRSAARGFEVPDEWRAQDPQVPKSRWWLPKLGIIGFRVVCETQPGNRWEVPAE